MRVVKVSVFERNCLLIITKELLEERGRHNLFVATGGCLISYNHRSASLDNADIKKTFRYLLVDSDIGLRLNREGTEI